MVQIFGSVERSVTQNGQQITVFRIPAFSKTGARQRAKANARIKGLSGASVDRAENVGSADIPGQKLFDVRMTSQT